jgi:hypothetical protein
MLLLGIPAAVFACIQIYKAAKTPPPTPRKPKPTTQKKTYTLSLTSEVVIGEGK